MHIGGGREISGKSIIAILSLKTIVDPATRGFLSRVQQEGGAEFISGTSKSCVIACSGGKDLVYYSPLDASTLSGRSRRKSGA